MPPDPDPAAPEPAPDSKADARNPPPKDDPWFQATWEGAELATLMHGARMTMAEKLAWLDSMATLFGDHGD